MEKRGTLGEILWDNAFHLLVVVIFIFGMVLFVNSWQGGGAFWERYYAVEISKMINVAQPGEEITLDVTKATEIAKSNNVADLRKIVNIDNENAEVCVHLSQGRSSCYSYFNDLLVVDEQINFGLSGNKNVLVFRVVERTKGAANG